MQIDYYFADKLPEKEQELAKKTRIKMKNPKNMNQELSTSHKQNQFKQNIAHN